MRVLVTGSEGFIGKNLCQNLKEKQDIEIITFDKKDDFSIIEQNIESISFIYHLAGINRPKDPSEFYEGNIDLTKTLCDLINEKNLDIPILYTSSIHALKDNDYGKSKKLAEDILLEYAKNHKVFIYRLHNVFGKWCKPNYNSVIATFCYNVVNNIELIINDPKTELELIYIDDIVAEFINLLDGIEPTIVEGKYYYINPIYKITLGKLSEMIKSFKESMNSIQVPETGDDFIKKLFSTYLSYIHLDDMVFTPKMNIDERGSFTELIRTESAGQMSVSISKPGIFRGNHYHHTKMEKFIVVKGKARIKFRHIITNEEKEYLVDDTIFKIVNIPVGYTHKIENIGDTEMILLIWCNELFDINKPDTFFMEVDNEKTKSNGRSRN